jgi:HD-GYP domain-containing protein (c-di-GMP phosphodiesterase class II)
LQQALEDKAELIEESFLDKERIKDQKETIELLTKRVREFEMARSVTTVSSTTTNSANSSLRVGSSKSNVSVSGLQVQVKQLSEDNIELAKEVDRLVAERDKLEKKLIDIKLRQQAGRQSSIASTDEDEDGVFASYESLGKKNRPKKLGYNKKGGSVFAAAKNWFASKKGSPSNAGGGGSSSGTTKKSSSSSNFVSYSPSRSVAV